MQIMSQTPVSIICDRLNLPISYYRLLSEHIAVENQNASERSNNLYDTTRPSRRVVSGSNQYLWPVLLNVHSHAFVNLAILNYAGIDQINRASGIAVAIDHIHEF